jgi:hypothetical protein
MGIERKILDRIYRMDRIGRGKARRGMRGLRVKKRFDHE